MTTSDYFEATHQALATEINVEVSYRRMTLSL